MGSLVLILPVLAFDFWLFAKVGKSLFQSWVKSKSWPRVVGLVAAGLALGVWLAFYVEYKWGAKMRVAGFPIPVAFSHLEEGKWGDFISPSGMQYAGVAVNFLTGLAAPLVPFKIAEFLRTVKAEL